MGSKVMIQITMAENGAVGVNGPLHDKILCMGLLEVAKAAVLTYVGEEKRIIEPAIMNAGMRKSN